VEVVQSRDGFCPLHLRPHARISGVNRRKSLQAVFQLGLCCFPPFPRLLRAATTKDGEYFPNYVDVATKAGLTARTVVGGHESKDFLVSTTGGGIALFDYDNDGWLDIFVVNSWGINSFSKGEEPTNHLYKNNGDGTFTDVTAKANLVRSGWGQGVCVGDYNNDGFLDLFVTYYGKNVLYRNNGEGTFTDVTRESGLLQAEDRWNSGGAFLDYDRDGHLDLFVSNYVGYDSGLALYDSDPSLVGVQSPVLHGPAGLQGSKNILYHNNGDGTFTDVSKVAGITKTDPTYGFTPCIADYDNDGWPDIYVANDSTPSLLFKNNHEGTFTEVGLLAGVAVDENGGTQGGMGVDAGDYDGDGFLDIIKTNFSDQTTSLYHNRGNGFFTDRTFQAGLSGQTSSVKWGTAFADFDNDGQPDVFIVTGTIYPPGLSGRRPRPKENEGKKILYRNLGNGRFEDISERSGGGLLASRCGRGAAFGDIFNSGQIDVVINNLNDVPSLLRNQSPSTNSWIVVRLVGTRTNRAAIGSRVIIESDGRRQMQEVRSGGSFCSQNDLRLHFGLGRAREATRIMVKWLSGGQEVLEHVAANRLLVIQEGKGIVGQEKF
jgi:enediyne biosynthesis protein E4